MSNGNPCRVSDLALSNLGMHVGKAGTEDGRRNKAVEVRHIPRSSNEMEVGGRTGLEHRKQHIVERYRVGRIYRNHDVATRLRH